MRLGMRSSKNSVLGTVVELDMMDKWDAGRSYDEALEVFSKGKDSKSFESTLAKFKNFVDNESYAECVILWNSESDLRPILFDKPDMSAYSADFWGESTTARPDVIELIAFEHDKMVEVYEKAFINGYIDYKDFDLVILTYKNIPETTGNGYKKVLVDLTR